ncbi:MAG: carbamoyltransferase HypF [Desulfurococcales archaeon]|nr:carbamoyltransferase HypF [Desulfurococcales archaeon]
MHRTALRIIVVGTVQGVGFRPYVEILARRASVAGYVKNLGGGEVEIHVEGDEQSVSNFIVMFEKLKPPVIKIEKLVIKQVKPINTREFRIEKSSGALKTPSDIPADLAICRDCIEELENPSSRRYRYPFNSCSYCGPRFSILDALPYDRDNTSMRHFNLCMDCKVEYSNAAIGGFRRYYYQGISCPRCGPSVKLLDSAGTPLDVKDPIAEAAKLVDEGYIVAVKGFGGYHLAALASDDDVVLKLRERKRRPFKPFAVMALNLEVASQLVKISPKAAQVLTSELRPILLLPKRENSPISPWVSPGLDKEGVFLPVTALHYLLLKSVKDRFAIMTSGNKSGSPMCTTLDCVKIALKDVVDYILDHNLKIVHRVDDSVARFTRGKLVLIRRARGFAPRRIKLPMRVEGLAVAFGAELDNVGGIGISDYAVLTQYIGDTDVIEALEGLERELKWLANVYIKGNKISYLVADLNPAYNSSRLCEEWSRDLGVTCVRIQHHYAHALSLCADAGLEPPFTAITIDGVGYGLDGMAWGGEVLVVDYNGFERVGHLKYSPMPGGDSAALYPAKMAIGLLVEDLGYRKALDVIERLGLHKAPPMSGIDDARLVSLQALKEALKTSSLGRFLDAVSAVLGVRVKRTFEGEPAIALESFASKARVREVDTRRLKALSDIYLKSEGNRTIVDTPRFFSDLVEEYLNGAKPEDIALLAQEAVGYMLGLIACNASEGKVVGLTGGAAVNEYVARGVEKALRECRARVIMHSKVPPGDGGIALGQIYHVALSRK